MFKTLQSGITREGSPSKVITPSTLFEAKSRTLGDKERGTAWVRSPSIFGYRNWIYSVKALVSIHVT